MAKLNRVILIGRLTADPELRHTPNGHTVANFTLAVDRKFSKNSETDFIPCVAWRRLAEIINEYCHKGKLVSVEGSLQTRLYETTDGQKRKAYDVLVEDLQMLGSPSGGGGGGQAQPAPQPSGGFPPVNDDLDIDSIPF